MVMISRKERKYDRCCSCFSEKELYEIKIKHADAHAINITLCDACIQAFINKYKIFDAKEEQE